VPPPQRLLEQHGFAVQTAANGQEAFQRLVAAYQSGRPPAIAVIDMQARPSRAWLRFALSLTPCARAHL
jgi:hypothetical protein